MRDDLEVLINDAGPRVDVLLQEFKQAGVMPNGWYDIATNQEARRMIWAGQSPDGRRWDENQPEGQPARPWDGASDARVPMVDGICNADTAVLCAAFSKAELRAVAVDPEMAELTASVSKYLHWMVHTKYARALRMEVELSGQYTREHGWCVAYVGWERELGKRRQSFTIEGLRAFVQMIGSSFAEASEDGSSAAPAGVEQAAQAQAAADQAAEVVASILDPEQEEAAVEAVRGIYRDYVRRQLEDKGFFAEELEDEQVLELGAGAARRCVRELRASGETEVPMPYMVKNEPLCWVLTPYLEFLAARGTMKLQQARAVFWRRWMTEAELESKRAEGWDADWIETVRQTKGNISSWAGALGATSLTGPSTKTVGNTTYLKVTEENNPLIEVVYAYVKKVDEEGVTGVYETIFSPHVTRKADGSGEPDFCAKHTLLSYAHGRYPFVEFKRENIGRALTDTRSVAEVASTWQGEEKAQRDMLLNRAQWDTLPPVRVPKLGGVDYRLGPGAQVPLARNDEITALNLNAPAPELALELIKLLRLQADDYFGQFNAELSPAKLGALQAKAVGDFYGFWGEVLLQMFALTLQYNAAEIVRVCGDERVGALDPFDVLAQLRFGLEFDVQELNPDYLLKKLEMVHGQVLPADAGGVIDRSALTNLELRMLDPRLAEKVVLDRGAASQKLYRDVDQQVLRMALGNEAEYSENDPSAGMKLGFLQGIMRSNPKYQQFLQAVPRFKELLEKYVQNLQMSVMQEQNKTVGRIGVTPEGGGMGGMGMMGGMGNSQ